VEIKSYSSDKEKLFNDYFFSPSGLVNKSLLYANIQPEKILLLPYGSNFLPNNRSFKCCKESINLVFVGRITLLKGVYFLLETLESYRNKSCFSLTLIGDYSSDTSLPTKYSQHKFIGNINNDDVVRYLDEADVLIFPSLFEGLPYSILESISRGLLILCSNTSGVNEILSPDYDFIFESMSSISLSEKLDLLLSCDCLQLEKNQKILDSIRQNYTWENYMKNFISHLTSISKNYDD
jgi:glycosyltransferase involved in cell wall biosynthesis